MLSSTLVPVCHYIGRLYAYISSINHAHCILRLISCFYICDYVGVVKDLYITFLIHKEQFAFQVHVLRLTIKMGFWGTLDGCMIALM